VPAPGFVCHAKYAYVSQGLWRGLGLPTKIRFHDLRHIAGTLALRQGVPLHTISRMLGHSDPAMTLRRYAHVLEDMREDAARAMDDLF
jgi:integrase